jgi:hypothetical protein
VAGGLEGGAKLGSAIDLDGADGKKNPSAEGVEKARGGGGGLTTDLDPVPEREHVKRGEVLEHQGWARAHVERMDLDQAPGTGGR